ncbi:MAG TPA: FliM/FliN family flagellar motor switch protein [Candidatus Acidoferrum sp.]|jgi:flagellar motor switch protein FliN/FliY
MTESTPSPAVNRFCKVWVNCFSNFLTSLAVASAVVEGTDPVSAPAPTSQEFESLVCIRFTGGEAIKGELLWVAEKPAALQLAQLLMSEPPDPSAEFGENQRDAFAELLRQVSGQVATAWKAESGAVIELIFQPTVEPAPVTAQSATLRLKGDKFSEISLRLFLDEDLCGALGALPAPEPAPAQAPPTTSKQVIEAADLPDVPPPPPRTTPLPSNLALVLDVELQATIRFGERQMLLRDIFGLMPGAVVELDHMVNEPAQLLVAGRLVARGEVVVVDGNFGLRITEVASVNERAAAINL